MTAPSGASDTSADSTGPGAEPALAEALERAREDALRYRRAYELVSGALSDTAAELIGKHQEREALDHARLVAVYGPRDVVCYDYWLRAGASVAQEPFGAVIVTPVGAWHYAAALRLDFSGVDFAAEDCWVRVRLGGVVGEMGVALYDEAANGILANAMAEAEQGVRQLLLKAEDASASLLLFRNGAAEGESRAVFVGAEMVVAPKPAPGQGSGPPIETVPISTRDLAPFRALISQLQDARQKAAVALVDSIAPALERRGPMLDRRVLTPLARAMRWWRMTLGAPRTLWGVTPILTLPLLARGDRLLGLRSASVVYTTYVISKRFDINLKRLMGWMGAHRPQWLEPLQTVVLHLSRVHFDAYHYFCDRGLSPQARIGLNEPELKLIRDSGHRLYAYAYGGDVRTRLRTLALGAHNLCHACPAPTTLCICDDAHGEANQAMIARYASAVVSMGDMVAYAPHPRIQPYWPVDVARVRYVGSDWRPGRPLRVAHAPNHPYFKGTNFLLDAIARLQAEGRAIELIRVQGVPNDQVMRLFEEADIVADQFVSGAHGYTAFEAMALGKPVLCYLRDRSMVLDADVCPIINAWPESVYQTLKDCLDGRYDLADIGRRSRSYIEHHHSIEANAIRLGQMYLETAGFPERVNRRIRGRMTRLLAGLPPLAGGPAPVPWSTVPGANPRPALAA